MRVGLLLTLLVTILCVFALAKPSFAQSTPPSILINEIAFKDSPDWVELYVAADADLTGVRVYEGAATLLKELPNITATGGDYVVLHFNGNPVNDETNTTGRGENGHWDVYTADTGLIGTDNILRLQSPGTAAINTTDTLDAVIWSDNNGSFTSSQSTANELVAAGHWNSFDFITGDSGAWTDSDDVTVTQTIGRDSLSADTHQKVDWSQFAYSTTGTTNVAITPTPTSSPTPLPSAPSPNSGQVTPTSGQAIPTFTPSPTEGPTPMSTPGVTPTPQIAALTISFSSPDQATVGESFPITGQIDHAEQGTTYYIKFEASSDGDNLPAQAGWYAGQTLGVDDQILSWNTSWSKFPTVTTDDSGSADFEVEAQIRGSTSPGKYQTRIKIKPTDSSKTTVSKLQTLTATLSDSSQTSNTQETSEVSSGLQIAKNSSTTSNIDTDTTSLTLSLIADVREKDIATPVKIEGVVTAPPELLGSRVMYIEDESGGIKILLDRKDRDDIKYGDLVKVTGTIGESFDETYIKITAADDVRVLGAGDLPDPLIIETGQLDEDNEGQLVTVNGEIVATSGNTFYVDDGSGEIKVYIKDSTGIDKPAMRKGYFSQITGINSQYKDDYRLLPRFLEDLIISTVPILANKDGDVLGAQTLAAIATSGQNTGTNQLPRTGFSTSNLGFILVWAGLVLRRLHPAQRAINPPR